MIAAGLIVLMLVCLVFAPCLVARYIRATTHNNLHGTESHAWHGHS